MKQLLTTAALAAACGFLGAATWSVTGLADKRTEAYLLDNPQLLPAMAQAYEEQAASDRLAQIGDQVYEPFPGAVLGNPNGSKVLVEFTDYNCPYCRVASKQVADLIAQDPEVKVVIREWSIFQGSEVASRMALAAADQGKFPEFHKAMFELAPASAESVREAAERVGLDMTRAQEFGQSRVVEAELRSNALIAQQMGFTGTPSWIAGGTTFEGAIGTSALQTALDR
ncbi:DsbA family protein [Altererythrobacter lutimaris]|uniref:DsbA family protein n=1 Tax=Altererythrobacter lutimaris TaxID=2743979 RepID=A0A850HC41_9SPHN|nr:DsbA family protein [Altererythrobacter lutimaris]NVE95329.1 DsbA family protein [Altererythrobacter lutimaris]